MLCRGLRGWLVAKQRPLQLQSGLAGPPARGPPSRRRILLSAPNSRRVKCILAVFKYGLECSKECLLSEKHSDACGTACGTAHADWHAVLRQLDQQVRAQVASSERSAREAEAWIEYADVKAAEERLRTEYGSQRHLLLSFAALTEPVRGGDLGRVRLCGVGAAPATGNYIEQPPAGAAGKTVLVLREHKTAHAAKVGTLVRVLPQQLAAVVRASLEASPRDWLFEAPRGGPFTEEAHFTAWANRMYKAVFRKPVTANILRHTFISAIDVNRTSTAALEATAAHFSHSLATQIAYRRLSPSTKRKASAVDDGELLVALRSADTTEGGAGATEGEAQTQELEAAHALLALSRQAKEPRRARA